MEPNYESFLSYNFSSSRDYVRLINGAKGPIAGYRNRLVRPGGKFIYKQNVLHIPGLREPLYYLIQHYKLHNCGYIGDNKGTHMWFPSFDITADYRVDNLVTYESMGIPYRFVKKEYKKPLHKAVSNTSMTSIQPTPISQEATYTSLSLSK